MSQPPIPLQPGNWLVHVYHDGTYSAGRVDMHIPIQGYESEPIPPGPDRIIDFDGGPIWPEVRAWFSRRFWRGRA